MRTLVELLVLAAIVYMLNWALRRQAKKGISSRLPAPPKPLRAATFQQPISSHHWTDGGNFDFEVVGESNYQRALEKLAGEHGSNGARTSCTATIIPEDDNHYDNKAVAVYVQEVKIGYLSREDARSFRRRLSSKRLTGQATTCDAVIVGGRVEKGRKQGYGVWLDMKPFD